MGSGTGVLVPMVVATGSVVLGSSLGGPKTGRSTFGVVTGAFIATFGLTLLSSSAPELAHGIALLAAVSALLVYGPAVAKSVNSIK
jgi:hypothetical protein